MNSANAVNVVAKVTTYALISKKKKKTKVKTLLGNSSRVALNTPVSPLKGGELEAWIPSFSRFHIFTFSR